MAALDEVKSNADPLCCILPHTPYDIILSNNPCHRVVAGIHQSGIGSGLLDNARDVL
jgi:hypothetical protein